MVLLELDPILISAAGTLAVMPTLLTVWFLRHGRRARVYDLQSYFSPTQRARELVDTVEDPDQTFRDYLTGRYREQHRVGRYLVPFVSFHLAYWVGLYWSFVAVGVHTGAAVVTWPDALTSSVVIAAVGFLGGVLNVLWHLFWRTLLTDLQPKTFIHLTARLLVAPILGLVLGAFVSVFAAPETAVLFVAFGAGMFADAALRAIEQRWLDRLGLADALRQPLPVRNLEGVSYNDELRLWEEGITDAEHLAVETIDNLLINTKYTLERIIDWKDQAFLYAYVAEDIPKWRAALNRGALDVIGMAEEYYEGDRAALLAALAETLGKPVPLIERFIDTIFQDPRVRQLWKYLCSAYPSEQVKPLDEMEAREVEAAGEGGSEAARPEPKVLPQAMP